MKIYLLTIIFFFVSVFAEAETIDPQFAIDALTGKTTSSVLPCTGYAGSGCENIVPQMSVDRSQSHVKSVPRSVNTPNMTPANPINYARQQLPRYSTWGYVPSRPFMPQIRPVTAVDTRRMEVASIYGSLPVEEYNRRVLARIAARQEAERQAREQEQSIIQEQESPVTRETISLKTVTPMFVVAQTSPDTSIPVNLATRAFVVPGWLYEVLWRIMVGILVSFIIGWELKILLRT